MRAEIEEVLAGIEQEEGVRVLYACESGSRAWGFPSRDSDYDVRFLYLRPREWYLSIDLERRRDVIERPVRDLLDVNGWDLRKALGLLRKTNPPLLEWLRSPIVYRATSSVPARLRELCSTCYNPAACHHHYLNMARGNFREYLQGPEVRIKKYFYVLRPVLAVLWLERGLGPVPVEFGVLVEALVDDPALRAEIDALVRRKRAGEELRSGPRIPAVSDFLERELERLGAATPPEPRACPVEPLNALFREALEEVWGG